MYLQSIHYCLQRSHASNWQYELLHPQVYHSSRSRWLWADNWGHIDNWYGSAAQRSALVDHVYHTIWCQKDQQPDKIRKSRMYTYKKYIPYSRRQYHWPKSQLNNYNSTNFRKKLILHHPDSKSSTLPLFHPHWPSTLYEMQLILRNQGRNYTRMEDLFKKIFKF